MIEALVVSNLLLWVAVLALAALVVALMRQLGVLYERVAPAGALVAGAAPRVGERAPVVAVVDLAGTPVSLGAPSADGRRSLLFFLSPTCPVCKTLLPVVRQIGRAEVRTLRVVLASDGPRDEHVAFAREHALDEREYVLGAALGLAYRVAKLPYAVLVDAAGIVRAEGLVNTREHLESLFEAMERGVASLDEYLAQKRQEVA
ncbi:MAG TPA: methylamine dehydrogenase accessory protein MauD [Myxococcota bacterium]|nr:methylamine dehydrogenase accessory protein MauD [Myxococcota bacterium]